MHFRSALSSLILLGLAAPVWVDGAASGPARETGKEAPPPSLTHTLPSPPALPASDPASVYVPGLAADNWSASLPEPAAPPVSPLIAAEGRQLYDELERARAAATAREATNLYAALGEARETLGRLDRFWAQTGVHGELQALQADLAHEGEAPDAGLWSGVKAEVEGTYGLAPPDVIHKALEALERGREAASRGDRTAALQALDALFALPGLGDGVFPLQGVSNDVDAALKAADRRPRDWEGALHAITHALDQVSWLNPSRTP